MWLGQETGHNSVFSLRELTPPARQSAIRKPRSAIGSTLTEVLVALLILSIGVVSVITLFPLSILRSLRASQLTKATDLRFNAEAMISLYPAMITDPDLNPQTDVRPEYFVIDPYGWVNVTNAGGNANSFGNVNGSVYGNDFTTVPGVNIGGTNRYNLLRNTLSLSDPLVVLPDSWNQIYDGFASNPTPAGAATQITITGLSGTGFTLVGGITFRAVIFSDDGTASQARILTNVSGDTVMWTEDINSNSSLDPGEDLNGNGVIDQYPLPANFTPGFVRIDAQDRRYTWLLTCRKTTADNQADVDVVVFFGREEGTPIADESLYSATFIKGRSDVVVDYLSGTPPTARLGSFVFDAGNARWYRIVGVKLATPNANQMTLTIDAPAVEGNPLDPFAGTPRTNYAMFPRGVVEVFPLGMRP